MCEYWKQDRPNIYWKDGWILDVLRAVFWFFSRLSISRVIVYFKARKYGSGHRKLYQCVDWYVFSWILILILFIIMVNVLSIRFPCSCIIVAFVSYRLFDTWQSWVSQFVLSAQWSPRSVYRSLVLVFLGYIEVTFLFSLLAFIFKDDFMGIYCWSQSLLYGFGNAATIGSGIAPVTGVGYTLFAVQIMFTLLFLTAIINRIVSAMK